MNMTYEGSKAGTWRWLALPASVALNLFLIAAISAHVLHMRQSEVSPGTSLLGRALANAEASLSKTDAAAFGAVMRRDEPQYSKQAQQLAQARAEFDRRITAEPFDKEATRQAFRNWQDRWNDLMNSLANPLVDALAEVSPEGRQKLVEVRRQAQGANP